MISRASICGALLLCSIAVSLGASAQPAQEPQLEFKPSLEARSRVETRIEPLTTDDNQYFVATRIRFGAEGRWGKHRIFAQVQDSRRFGELSATRMTAGTTEFLQGYLELAADFGYLRLGRQQIEYGAGRLIGLSNWTNGQSFDALRLHGTWGSVDADFFASVVSFQRDIGSRNTEGDYLGGLALTWKASDAFTLEPYLLFRHDGPTESGAADAPLRERNRNIGAAALHLKGEVSIIKFDVEGVFQYGDEGDAGGEFLAFAAQGDGTVSLPLPLQPAVTVGASYGSAPSSDGKVDGFDLFYPTKHARFGSADLLGWRNQITGYLKAAIVPIPSLQITASGWLLMLADPAGSWFDSNGGAVANSNNNDERHLGTEIDVDLRWGIMKQVGLFAGYSMFMPGAGAAALGKDQTRHWAYLMMQAQLP